MGHFQTGGRHYAGTPNEQALDVSMLPMVILGGALGADETFRQYAREVADDPSRADGFASLHARRGAGREAIAAMLHKAAAAPPAALTTRLMNMSRRRACFVDGPLDADAPRNALQQRYIAQLFRGAELVVRRGQRRCLRCGTKLAAYNTRLYCAAHASEKDPEKPRERAAMTTILRAVAEEIGIPSDGQRARRARRTVPRTTS